MDPGRSSSSGTDSVRPASPGLHVAIVMDGNGRWAAARGMRRMVGHLAGMGAVRRVVARAPGLGIDVLTLFAFSSDNWHRPPEEVLALMDLFERYLGEDEGIFSARGIRAGIIGRRDRLPSALLMRADAVEKATAAGAGMRLQIALDYSSRDAVLRASARLAALSDRSRSVFTGLLAEVQHQNPAVGPVDFLIRPGGELRLSDCVLWDAAYAELYFTETRWPDFGGNDLASALAAFHRRERRFGRVSDLPERALLLDADTRVAPVDARAEGVPAGTARGPSTGIPRATSRCATSQEAIPEPGSRIGAPEEGQTARAPEGNTR